MAKKTISGDILHKIIEDKNTYIDELIDQRRQLEGIIEDLKTEVNEKNEIIKRYDILTDEQMKIIKEKIKEVKNKKYIKTIVGAFMAYGIITFITLNPNIFDWSNFSRLAFLLLAPILSIKK